MTAPLALSVGAGGLGARNAEACAAVDAFRAATHPDRFGALDAAFHRHKNRHPYFGFVAIDTGAPVFDMFCGNDDLVALTYFWHGPRSFEPHSLALWTDMARGARHVWDVGAFSGVYALAAATAGAESVDAFEPARRTHARLLLNVHANGLQHRVRPVNAAASDAPGEATLMQFRGEHVLGNGASLLPKDMPVVDGSERVGVVALDDHARLSGRLPDLVKIDVEGLEDRVLAGMARTLALARPRLIVEVTPTTFDAVRDRLAAARYDVRAVDERAGRAEPRDAVEGVVNLVAVPREDGA